MNKLDEALETFCDVHPSCSECSDQSRETRKRQIKTLMLEIAKDLAVDTGFIRDPIIDLAAFEAAVEEL